MRKPTIALAVALALVAPLRGAGPILDSANRYASQLTPDLGCQRAMNAGDAAAQGQGASARWLVAGIFLPGLMPLAAGSTDPLPSTAARGGLAGSDAKCFEDGYRQRGRAERVRSAWIGSGIGLAFYVVAAAIVAGGVDSQQRWW